MIRVSKLTDYAIVLLAHLSQSDRTLNAQELSSLPLSAIAWRRAAAVESPALVTLGASAS